MTLALVSLKRNRGSGAQTSIFTIDNDIFLVEIPPQASWPPDVPAESLKARSPQPAVLSQPSSARIPQPGVLSKDSSARKCQAGILSQESSASSLQPICLGSALESFNIFNRFGVMCWYHLLSTCIAAGISQMSLQTNLFRSMLFSSRKADKLQQALYNVVYITIGPPRKICKQYLLFILPTDGQNA